MQFVFLFIMMFALLACSPSAPVKKEEKVPTEQKDDNTDVDYSESEPDSDS